MKAAVFALFLFLFSCGYPCAEGEAEVGAESGRFINTDIEEASGITYVPNRGTLFVVDDEGTLFEIDTSGNVLNSRYLGEYDLEGVTTDRNGNLILAVEGEDALLSVDMNTLEIIDRKPVSRSFGGSMILVPDESHGIEGVCRVGETVYVVNQSYAVSSENQNGDEPSALLVLREKQRSYRIDTVVDFPYGDLSGIAEHDGYLHILSDDDDVVLIYAPERMQIIEVWHAPVTGEQEGIAYDDSGNVYIAVDGEGIFKRKWQPKNNAK